MKKAIITLLMALGVLGFLNSLYFFILYAWLTATPQAEQYNARVRGQWHFGILVAIVALEVVAVVVLVRASAKRRQE